MIFQNLLHTGIRHSLIYPDHRLGNLMVHHPPFLINLHNTTKRQTILSLIQRTNSIGQRMRKHRNNPIHQIHTGSSLECFPIQRAVFLYIIGDIGNMNAQYITVSFSCNRNCIVQILGILPINGNHLPISKILSSLSISF